MKYIVLNTYGDTFPSSFTGFIQGLGNTWLDVDSIFDEERAIRTSEIDKLIEVLTPGTNLVYFMGSGPVSVKNNRILLQALHSCLSVEKRVVYTLVTRYSMLFPEMASDYLETASFRLAVQDIETTIRTHADTPLNILSVCIPHTFEYLHAREQNLVTYTHKDTKPKDKMYAYGQTADNIQASLYYTIVDFMPHAGVPVVRILPSVRIPIGSKEIYEV